MGNVVPANMVMCPKCAHTFEYNVVNGIALVDIVGRIDSRKRMYCRLTLDSLERVDNSKELSFQVIKKIVLDNFNDFNRDTQTLLGFGLEVE